MLFFACSQTMACIFQVKMHIITRRILTAWIPLKVPQRLLAYIPFKVRFLAIFFPSIGVHYTYLAQR